MAETVFALMMSGFRGERVPVITTMLAQDGEKYESPGYTFDEAKAELIKWLDNKKEEIEQLKEEDL